MTKSKSVTGRDPSSGNVLEVAIKDGEASMLIVGQGGQYTTCGETMFLTITLGRSEDNRQDPQSFDALPKPRTEGGKWYVVPR